MHTQLPRLPFGKSDFQLIRYQNCAYVDKTELIYRLASGKRDRLLFLRPRRFGKSLLISTLESLFKDAVRDFAGLAIASLWREPRYLVVRLDFSQAQHFCDFEGFQKAFNDHLLETFTPVGFVYTGSKGLSVISQLSVWLHSQPTRSVVLLIDEYDAPLTQNLKDPVLFDKVASYLCLFFEEVNRADHAFRFLFVTGITNLISTRLKSAYDSLQDISLDPDFSALLGFTRDEIKTTFSAHLTHASQCLKQSVDAVLDLMETHYAGFAFESNAQTHVFCPWSVIGFLLDPQAGFKNYWFTSGGIPDLLVNALKTDPWVNFEGFREGRTILLSELETPPTFESDVLFTHAGYYTIKSSDGLTVRLGYPNIEVASSMASLLVSALIKPGASIMSANYSSIEDLFDKGSVEEVIQYLTAVFRALDEERLPLVDEAAIQSYLQLVLYAAGIPCQSEQVPHDLAITVGARTWVLKVMLARPDDNSYSQLKTAIAQISIPEREPIVSPVNSEHTIIQVALVVSLAKKDIVAWTRA